MKRFSFWALNHKTLARIVIVFCYLLLNLFGWITGNILFSINIILTPVFFYVITSIVTGAVVIYLFKKNTLFKSSYARRKTADLLLTTATFFFIIYSSNSLDLGRSLNPLNKTFSISVPNSNSSELVNIENTLSKKKPYNISKKDFKKYMHSITKAIKRNYKDSSKGEKVVLIILLIIASVFMIFLISALACNIICSGAEALGYIVLVAGIAAVIFGLIKLIQRVRRGPRQKKKPLAVTE